MLCALMYHSADLIGISILSYNIAFQSSGGPGILFRSFVCQQRQEVKSVAERVDHQQNKRTGPHYSCNGCQRQVTGRPVIYSVLSRFSCT